ncbi:MAG: hypothetical protein KA419_05985 [Acidobacteria bacterium]|nr:hypothetical protein [Acidobacteriota bacterium]
MARRPAKPRRGCRTFLLHVLVAGALLWLAHCVVHRVAGGAFLAARWNGEGTRRFAEGKLPAARALFEKSAAERYHEEVPAHNLGRCHLEEKDYTEAHAAFERSREASPRFAPSLYNDGHALYGWGGTLADFPGADSGEREEACRRADLLKKAAALWEQAIACFEAAEKAAGTDALRRDARENAAFLRRELEVLKRHQEEYRRRCEAENAGGGASGGSQGQGQGQGGQQGRGQGQPPSAGGQGSGGQPPPAASQGRGQPPPAGGRQGQPPSGPKGGGAGQQPPSGGGGSAQAGSGLSEAEREEIEASVRRQEKQRREKGHFHRQTAPQQWRKKAPGEGGREVLW